jgi:hypothetical protein
MKVAVPYETVQQIRAEYEEMKGQGKRSKIKILADRYQLPVNTIMDYVYYRTRKYNDELLTTKRRQVMLDNLANMKLKRGEAL